MPFPKRDVRLMIAILRATRQSVRELIRDWELASSHQLDHMRHIRMLEEQAVYGREGGFDKIYIIFEMH